MKLLIAILALSLMGCEKEPKPVDPFAEISGEKQTCTKKVDYTECLVYNSQGKHVGTKIISERQKTNEELEAEYLRLKIEALKKELAGNKIDLKGED